MTNRTNTDELEKRIGIINLSNQQQFQTMLHLDRAIVYISVNWSGPERISRYCVYQALDQIQNKIIPVIKIDCSEQDNRYIEEWLADQKESNKHVYSGGCGETLLIKQGNIIDMIRNPGQSGPEKTKEMLTDWYKHL